MATVVQGQANFLAGPVFYPASVKGVWTTIHNNLTAAASSAANLVTPSNQSDTNAIYVRVPDNCTRAVIRGKCAVAISAVATNPIIFVYGIETNNNNLGTNDTLPTDITYSRRDVVAPALANATGLTLTFGAAGSNTQVRDATFLYTGETAEIDVEGAAYITVLVSQAASLTASGTTTAEVKFLN